jgi:hypothetical protein
MKIEQLLLKMKSDVPQCVHAGETRENSNAEKHHDPTWPESLHRTE